MSVIIRGVREDVPGLVTRSWLDSPPVARLTREDCGPRPTGTWVRSIVLHTTHGTFPQPLREGLGAGGGARANLSAWSHDHRCAGSHLLVDTDGQIYCAADLVLEETWHATSINRDSIGIEMVQLGDGGLYVGQLDVAARLVDWLTGRLKIQRQIPKSYVGELKRLHKGGNDFVGICGHRDQTDGRGRGDPGDAIFARLAARGYERFDLGAGEDLAVWKARQTSLGLTGDQVDGIPGMDTCKLLEAGGHTNGLWVQ